MKKKKYHEALYDYISTGSQGLVVKINGRTYRFRHPTSEDVTGSNDFAKYELEKSTYLLASCLQTMGGFQVSKEHRYEILQLLLETPKFADRVTPYFWKSLKEAQEYASFFEAFCYTAKSRNLWYDWKQATRFGFNLFAQEFPMTDLQKSWISYNQQEDKKQEIEEQWSRSFFVASSMNSKGVQKIQKEWDRKREKEKEYREKLIDEANKGELITEEKKDEIKHEKTVDQLQTEYWDWVDGKEDAHDRAVREYKEEIQRSLENRRNLINKQIQEAREMAEQVYELNSLSIGSPIRAYTDDEVAKMTQDRQKNTISFDEGLEYAEHLSKKYLQSPRLPGQSMPSLQDQIQNRPAPKIER
jgi:hypothetical protein